MRRSTITSNELYSEHETVQTRHDLMYFIYPKNRRPKESVRSSRTVSQEIFYETLYVLISILDLHEVLNFQIKSDLRTFLGRLLN